jgi:O-antigen ligase
MTESYAPPLNNRLERFVRYAVLGLLVWLPLPLGSNSDWAQGVMVFIISGLGCAWAIVLLRGPVRNTAIKAGLPMLVLLLLSQAWVVAQWFFGFSMDRGATFQNLILGLTYSLLFVLILSFFNSRERLNLLLGTLIFSGTLQAFWGAFMTLSGAEWLMLSGKTTYVGDATGTFVNRNHLAGYLQITLACGIGLLLALRDNRRFSWLSVLELLIGPKARLRLALVIMVIALVMTHSRMGNTAFFVSLVLVGGLFIILEKQKRLRNSLILGSIILIDILVVSQFFGLEKLKDRVLNTRFNDVVASGEIIHRANEIRDDVFVYTLPLLQDKPLFGQGAGSFEAVFQAYAGNDIHAHFDHAHNDYIQFAIEYGLIGFIPLAAFTLMALWYAFGAVWQRKSIYRKGIGFGATMGITSILIHSTTDFNLQIPANAATFVVLCAIAVIAGTKLEAESSTGT